MKNKFKIIISLICAVFIFIIPVSAGLVNSDAGGENYVPVSSQAGKSISVPLYEETPPLSPAVNIIRNRFELKKTALLNSDITFKPEEFEKILGIKRLKYITITKLPPISEGVLTLGGSDILEGQTVSRENIKYIRLVPYPNRIGTIKFQFKNADDTSKDSAIKCTVSVLESLNFSPSASPISITTQKEIPVFKSMNGSDPDGDNFYYRIVKGPKNGLLEIKDAQTGSFVYRPGKNFTGNDSFIYQVEDEYGNLSNLAAADIKVTKAACGIRFSDMNDHWAANSAIKAAAAGFIDLNTGEESDLIFEPETLMTRAAFVEMVLRAAKLDKNMPEVYKTGFADDSDIPFKYKSYVKKAYELGIVNGISTATGLYFDPNNIITRAEAAVIINNILKIPANGSISSKPIFKDAIFIPEWAEKDIAALNACGIIKGEANGSVNPNGLLSKAQSVEMLSAMLDYNKNLKKTGGFFSFLFR